MMVLKKQEFKKLRSDIEFQLKDAPKHKKLKSRLRMINSVIESEGEEFKAKLGDYIEKYIKVKSCNTNTNTNFSNYQLPEDDTPIQTYDDSLPEDELFLTRHETFEYYKSLSIFKEILIPSIVSSIPLVE
jgi:hypothetical protein